MTTLGISEGEPEAEYLENDWRQRLGSYGTSIEMTYGEWNGHVIAIM